MGATLSPDTDRKLVELAILSGVLDARAVDALDSVRSQAIARGEAVKTLAEMLVDSGQLDRGWASTFLGEVRKARTHADSSTERIAAQGVLGYTLLEELGRGGMGRVYRARHTATGAERALKIMTLAADGETLARFQREMEALARAAGGGVIRIHESGTEQGRPWYAMAVMPGGSLRRRLTERGRLPWPEAVDLILAVGSGLARCHAAGLVHRDLKPENVLFDEEDRPTLADFGCARDLSAQERLTVTGEVLGTLDYMAPEQIQGKMVGAQADVHALGSILYEVVTGERAFKEASSPYAALVARDTVPSARARVKEIPEALDAAIARALAKRLEDRHASVDALLAELRAIPRPATGKRRPALALALVLVLLGALALGAGVVASRRHPAKPAPGGVATTGPVVSSAPTLPKEPPPSMPAEDLAELERGLVAGRTEAATEVALVASTCTPTEWARLVKAATTGLARIRLSRESQLEEVERCLSLLRLVRRAGREPALPEGLEAWVGANLNGSNNHWVALAALCACVPTEPAPDDRWLVMLYQLGGGTTSDRERVSASVAELRERVRGDAARKGVERIRARYSALAGDFGPALEALPHADAEYAENLSTDMQKFGLMYVAPENVRRYVQVLEGPIRTLALELPLRWVRLFVIVGDGRRPVVPDDDLVELAAGDFEKCKELRDERLWWAYSSWASFITGTGKDDERARRLLEERDALPNQPDLDDRSNTELAWACLLLLAGDEKEAARHLERDRDHGVAYAAEARAATTPEARRALARKMFPGRPW